MEKFDQYISLGFFCSVAMELERKGLRKASYPFDWVISDDFEKVLNLIENGFENYLNPDFLIQETIASHYFNNKTGIHFFHDFNEHEPLSSQLSAVSTKYTRRIVRFYRDITRPTLFIRYCHNNDFAFIKNNSDRINICISSFNPNNRILYIIPNSEINAFVPDVHGGGVLYLKDTLRRSWINISPKLMYFLYRNISFDSKQIINNLRVHLVSRIRKKIKQLKH